MFVIRDEKSLVYRCCLPDMEIAQQEKNQLEVIYKPLVKALGIVKTFAITQENICPLGLDGEESHAQNS